MAEVSNIKGFTIFFIVSFFLLCLRLVYLFSEPYGIFFDEAQYWTWSKDFAFGYFSKPPIIAWLIAFTTDFCGDKTACVRLSATFCHFIAGLFVYLTARRLYTEKTGFWAGILYLTLPGISASSYFISADAPLMMFWAASLYFFVKAIVDRNFIYWILLGICAGLGMMSKYTMIMFFASAFLYMLFSPSFRKLIFSPATIFTSLLSLAIFAPNLYWNLQNDFISFRHTGDNVFSYGFSLYPDKMFEFIGAQFAVFGPVSFIALLIFFIRKKKICESEDEKMLVSFTYTLLFIAFAVALISGAQAHWAAPAYIAGSILLARVFVKKGQIRILTNIIGFNIALGLLFYHYADLSQRVSMPSDPFVRVAIWNGIAPKAYENLTKYPNRYIMTDERKSVATLMYNLRDRDGEPYPIVKWRRDDYVRDHYDMTTNLESYKGKNFIFITRSGDISDIKKYF